MKMYDFDGKVAVVTGAGGEMAGAMVKKFTENGACAALLDIREDLAQKTADALGLGEDKALCVKVDISDEESVKAAVQKIMDKFGRIDFLCNVAGIEGMASSSEAKSVISIMLASSMTKIECVGNVCSESIEKTRPLGLYFSKR